MYMRLVRLERYRRRCESYRHSRLDKNSAGLRDSELEALYETRGPGVTFREYGAINYAVSVIGGALALARARARAAQKPVCARSPTRSLLYSHVHVYAHRARYTFALAVPTTLLRSRSVLLGTDPL